MTATQQIMLKHFGSVWGNVTFSKVSSLCECKSLSLYVNQMFVPRMELDSLFNNYISRKSKWSSAHSMLCCSRIPHPALSAPLGCRCCWTVTRLRWHTALLRHEIDCCHTGHQCSWHQEGQDQSSLLVWHVSHNRRKAVLKNIYFYFRAWFELL